MAFHFENRFRRGPSGKTARSRRRAAPGSTLRGVEFLEVRELLSTLTVTNLHNSGAGSFRQAIIESNDQGGPNIIEFDVAGTIRIGSR
jgi:hypothetical protein